MLENTWEPQIHGMRLRQLWWWWTVKHHPKQRPSSLNKSWFYFQQKKKKNLGSNTLEIRLTGELTKNRGDNSKHERFLSNDSHLCSLGKLYTNISRKCSGIKQTVVEGLAMKCHYSCRRTSHSPLPLDKEMFTREVSLMPQVVIQKRTSTLGPLSRPNYGRIDSHEKIC